MAKTQYLSVLLCGSVWTQSASSGGFWIRVGFQKVIGGNMSRAMAFFSRSGMHRHRTKVRQPPVPMLAGHWAIVSFHYMVFDPSLIYTRLNPPGSCWILPYYYPLVPWLYVCCSVSGDQSLIIDPVPWHHGGLGDWGDPFHQTPSVFKH